jgi:hypothetical protein
LGASPDDGFEPYGFGNRIDHRHAKIGEDPYQPTQRSTGDNGEVQLSSLLFAGKDKECTKTCHAEEVQVTQVEDQRRLQLRKVAHHLGYELGVGRVDFASYPQDGTQTAGLNEQLGPGAVDHIRGVRILVALRWVYVGKSSHLIAPSQTAGKTGVKRSKTPLLNTPGRELNLLEKG